MVDDFEKIFGERLGELEGKPAEDQWHKISNRLHKDRWRERWLLVAILLPLFLTIPAILLLKNPLEPAHNINESLKNEDKNSIDNLLVNPEPDSFVDEAKLSESNASNDYQKSDSVHTNNHDNLSANYNSIGEAEFQRIDPVEPKGVLPFHYLQPINIFVSSEIKSSGSEKIIVSDHSERGRNMSLILSVQPNLNYGIYSPIGGDEILINNYEQSDLDRFGINLAIGFGYTINHRISLELQGMYRYHQQTMKYHYQDFSTENYQAIIDENSILITPEIGVGSSEVFEDFSSFGVDFGVIYLLNTSSQNQSLATGLSVFTHRASAQYLFNLGYRYNFAVGNWNCISLQPQLSYNLSTWAGSSHFSQRNYNVGIKFTFDYFLKKN